MELTQDTRHKTFTFNLNLKSHIESYIKHIRYVRHINCTKVQDNTVQGTNIS